MFSKTTKSSGNLDIWQTLKTIVQSLIKSDFYIPVSQEKKLNRLLLAAVTENKVALAKALIGKGADAKLKAKNRKTLLHIAVEKKSVEMARLLISCGADINLQSEQGNMWLWNNIFIKD